MKTEEYIGVLSNGESGRILFTNSTYKNVNEIIESKTPVYGFCMGHHIYLSHRKDALNDKDAIDTGFDRLVKITKITTEEIWHG